MQRHSPISAHRLSPGAAGQICPTAGDGSTLHLGQSESVPQCSGRHRAHWATDLAKIWTPRLLPTGSKVTATRNDSSYVCRFTRIIKPLRIIRLVRLLKIMQSKNILTHFSTVKTEPPPWIVLGKVFVFIFLAVHLSGCFYWLVKMICSDGADVEQFLTIQNLPPDASVAERYVVSIYFVSTVFTTVGFGDVSAVSTGERLYSIFIMFIG